MAKKPGLGERACPKCKETIKVDASLCKHCGTEFTADEIAAARAEGRKATKYAGLGCLGLVFFLGLCSYMIGGSDGSTSVPEKPTPDAKKDVVAFYRKVTGVIRPCDEAGSQVAKIAQLGDAVALYREAKTMESACLPISSDLANIDVPASVGKEAHAKLLETRKVCENAYVQRWSSARTMQKALEENGSIARMAELKEATELVQAGTIACAAGLVSEAMALGATEADLGMNKAK